MYVGLSIACFCKEDDKFFVKPKLLVCITCYNETKSQMEDSLSGVLDNLEYFKEA